MPEYQEMWMPEVYTADGIRAWLNDASEQNRLTGLQPAPAVIASIISDCAREIETLSDQNLRLYHGRTYAEYLKKRRARAEALLAEYENQTCINCGCDPNIMRND